MARTYGGLRRNLVSAIVAAIGALLLALLLLQDPLVQYRLNQHTRTSLLEAIDLATERLENGDLPEAVAESIGAEFGCRLTILDADHRVVGDGGLDGDALEDAPVQRDLIANATTRRLVTQADHDLVFDSAGLWTVQASRQRAMNERMRSAVRELLMLGGVMATLVALFLTWVLGRTLVEPARELTQVADALAEGDLDARIGWTDRQDELGAIGRAFDRLADELQERIARAREEQDRLRTILDSMNEAVFVTDSLGRIQLTNHTLTKLAEGSAEGRTPLEAIHNQTLHDAVREVRRSRQAAVVDLELAVAGETRYFEAHVAPLTRGQGVVALLHDVTQMQLAGIIRRDFVANASHELRTPLTAIRGFAETLIDGALSDPEVSKRYVEVILKHANRLEALAIDLTALSRAESPKFEMTTDEVDIGKLVSDIIDELVPVADLHHALVVMKQESGRLVVETHRRSVDQVVMNLLENAIKYSAAESAITVTVGEVEQSVTVSIHNDGPAIPLEHQARIFERFYRIDPGRSREVGGTGLGLSIVKHLCTRIGADVEVKSAPDEGVTFTVTIPVA